MIRNGQKIWRYLTKDTQATSIWKDTPHHMSWWNWKLKQADSTIKSMDKCRTLTTSNAGEDVEQHKSHSIAVGKGNWYNHSGRHLGSFLQNEPFSYHVIQQSHSLIITQIKWKLNPLKTCTQMPMNTFILHKHPFYLCKDLYK